MKRRISAFLCAGVFLAVSASPALADSGSPGSTFPEQPGGHVGNACVSVNTNPGTGIGGTVENHISPTAGAIVTGLLTDACTLD
jgi:hypothetical protein